MTKGDYINRMVQYETIQDEVWAMIVRDTNDFIRDNPNCDFGELKEVEGIADGLVMSGGWIIDMLTHKNPLRNGSITKKLRRVLGYND